MITKNFIPFYNSRVRFGYHNDDEVWKGNTPLGKVEKWNGISVVEKNTMSKKDLIRYDFNFGHCILFEDDETKDLRILNAQLSICDGWNLVIFIPLGSTDYHIVLDRITHEQCIQYKMIENQIKVWGATRYTQDEWKTPDDKQHELIENIVNMQVDDCKIWEIIQKILRDKFK